MILISKFLCTVAIVPKSGRSSVLSRSEEFTQLGMRKFRHLVLKKITQKIQAMLASIPLLNHLFRILKYEKFWVKLVNHLVYNMRRLPGGSDGKRLLCSWVWSLGWGRCLERESGNPLWEGIPALRIAWTVEPGNSDLRTGLTEPFTL